MPNDIKTLFCHNFKVDIDKSLNISFENENLYYQSFNEDKCELNYVGNNTVIDLNRKLLIKFDAINKQYFINDKKISVIASNKNLALDFIKIGNIKEAVRCYEDIMNNNQEVRLYLEKRLAMLALNLRNQGDVSTGIIILTVVLELFPEAPICWYILGEFYFECEKFELSIQAMEKSLVYGPENNNAKKFIKDAKKKLEI